MTIKGKIIDLLRWSEKYTKTDMAYVAKGSFWWLGGKIGLFVISLVTMVAFAHWLDPVHYGTYQLVLAGLALLSIFTLSGINTALIRSVARGKEGTLILAVKEKIKLGKIGAVLSFGLSIWYFIQGNNLLTGAFLIGAFFVPFKETFPIFAELWNGRKRFDQQAKYRVLSAFFSALLLIPVIYLTYIYLADNVITVLIIVIAFLAGHTFFDWIFYLKTKQQLRNREEDPEAIFFGKHLTLMSVLQTITIYLDKVIIWHFLGAAPLAIYIFALSPIQKIQEILPIMPLALPKLGENKIGKEEKRGIISKFLRLFAVTVPATVVLILIAPLLYKLIFPQYLDSIVYFQGLSLLIALSPFLLLSAALVTEIKKRALYIINTVAPPLKIILFLALIPHFGIWGIIAAILIDELLKGLLVLYFFLKI